MDNDTKRKILVTGFGPFSKYTVNASWEAVKELSDLCDKSEDFRDVQLVIEEIPVSYGHANTRVVELWKEHNPLFAVHVGVSYKADCLTIEQEAHSTGYSRPDIYDKCPDEKDLEENVIHTEVDINRICNNINENSSKTCYKACISNDAGRYLCEYVFYQSLRIHPMKSLFIHVPDFDVYTTSQSAKGLYDILYHLMQSLKESTKL